MKEAENYCLLDDESVSQWTAAHLDCLSQSVLVTPPTHFIKCWSLQRSYPTMNHLMGVVHKRLLCRQEWWFSWCRIGQVPMDARGMKIPHGIATKIIGHLANRNNVIHNNNLRCLQLLNYVTWVVPLVQFIDHQKGCLLYSRWGSC